MLKQRIISFLCAAAVTAAAIPAGVTVFAEDEVIPLDDKEQSGSAGWNNQNGYENAFDGDIGTYFDGLQNGYCSVDLGALYEISRLRFYPRQGRSSNKPSEYVERMAGGVFSGSADGSSWTTLYTVPDTIYEGENVPETVKWYEADVSGKYRYIKYENARHEANIAEMEIYGTFSAEGGDTPQASASPEPTGEPEYSGFELIDRTGWSVETNSQQATSGNNSVGMVIDGNPSTIWHSSWSNSEDYDPEMNPVYLTVNMGSKQSVSGLRYTPRVKDTTAGSINGVITAYEVYVSDDNSDWEKVGEGNMGYTADGEQTAKDIIFAPTEAQYIRLVVKDNLNNTPSYVGSCAEIEALRYAGEAEEHPIIAARAELSETVEAIAGLETDHAIKAKLSEKAEELMVPGTVDGIENFISAIGSVTDALRWMDRGIDDVYIERVMTILSDEDMSSSAVTSANSELSGFYRTGAEAEAIWADKWQDEFCMPEEDLEKPLYERIESAVTRAKARIDSNDGNDYIMLKELVSYLSRKNGYEGYGNEFGRNTDECEAIVNNINFTLSNLEKMDRGELDTELTMFRSGDMWLDTLGSKISAHGGQIIKQGDTYYWYGEDNKIAYALTTGVSCYSSKDLKNWKYEGLAFKAYDDGTEEGLFTQEFMTDGLLGTQGRIERPKVIYNENTGKYVMWMHLEKDGGYGLSLAGVAISDSPTGPFKWLWYGIPVYDNYVVNRTKNRTDILTFRDMNLFVDDDGKAYVFYSSESNQVMYAVQLNDEYTWINDEGLEIAGTTEDDIREGAVIVPDMRVTTNGVADNTYGKTSFTRYQLASGGGMALERTTNDDGETMYVSQRKDDRLFIPEYPETGRWARVGQNAAEENKVEGKTETTVNNSCNNQREAPAPIKIDGKYYMVTSALSGWRANPSLTQVTDNILGTWTPTGNPMTGAGPDNNGQWSQDATTATSFNSQSTCIIELPNGEYMYMGDRWKNGVYETNNSIGTFPDVDVKASTYVWLPITFETDNTYGENTLKVRWSDAWSYDEEQIYNDNAVPGTINIPVESQEEPVIWYSFDGIKDGVIPDRSGNGNSAALRGGGRYSGNEKIGLTLSLDTEGHIVLPDNITSNIEDFTVSMWINVTERGTGIHNKKLFDLGGKISYIPQGNNQYGYFMYTKFGEADIVSEKTQLAMDTSAPNRWTQLTIVKSGDTLSMYVNGILDTQDVISETTQSLGVLNGNTIGAGMALNIDEFKFYNRALSPAETLVRSAEGLEDGEAAEMIADGIVLGDTEDITEDLALPVYEGIITWSSSDEDVVAADGTVTRPASGTASAVLTARITVGGETVTREFNVTVAGTGDTPIETPEAPTSAPSETPEVPTDDPSETPEAPTDEPGETPGIPTDEPSETPGAPTDEPGETPDVPTDKPDSVTMEIMRTDGKAVCVYSVSSDETRELTAYLAAYNAQGILVSLKAVQLTSDGAELSIDIQEDEEYSFKAFVWDGEQTPAADIKEA